MVPTLCLKMQKSETMSSDFIFCNYAENIIKECQLCQMLKKDVEIWHTEGISDHLAVQVRFMKRLFRSLSCLIKLRMTPCSWQYLIRRAEMSKNRLDHSGILSSYNLHQSTLKTLDYERAFCNHLNMDQGFWWHTRPDKIPFGVMRVKASAC